VSKVLDLYRVKGMLELVHILSLKLPSRLAGFSSVGSEEVFLELGSTRKGV